MVSGPASRPSAVRVRRRSTINSMTVPEIRLGEVRGRRERGSKAASPSMRQRATHRETVAAETS